MLGGRGKISGTLELGGSCQSFLASREGAGGCPCPRGFSAVVSEFYICLFGAIRASSVAPWSIGE